MEPRDNPTSPPRRQRGRKSAALRVDPVDADGGIVSMDNSETLKERLALRAEIARARARAAQVRAGAARLRQLQRELAVLRAEEAALRRLH